MIRHSVFSAPFSFFISSHTTPYPARVASDTRLPPKAVFKEFLFCSFGAVSTKARASLTSTPTPIAFASGIISCRNSSSAGTLTDFMRREVGGFCGARQSRNRGKRDIYVKPASAKELPLHLGRLLT